MAKRIEIKSMSCFYGSFKAVEDVTLSVEPKSVTAFIGPSGCGKVDGAARAQPHARGRTRART